MKKNIDLTHDEYLKIHNAALLCEAAQQLYNVTEARVCGVDRQAYEISSRRHRSPRATWQDVHDHHDAADPQDATRYGADRRDVIDLNRAADLQHAEDLAANHADDLHQMDDLAANQDDDLQHGHDLVVGHQEDDLRPTDDLAAGLQDVIPTKITHLAVE
ncbi:unnamed protein product [Aphanomyces euteiches]